MKKLFVMAAMIACAASAMAAGPNDPYLFGYSGGQVISLNVTDALGNTYTFGTNYAEIGEYLNQGWWSNTQNNVNGNTNYVAAQNYFGANTNNYFSFNMGQYDIVAPIVSATLSIPTGETGSDGLPVTYYVGSVSVSAAALADKNNNPNAAIYAALGSANYGSVFVGAYPNPLNVVLNSAAIGALNAIRNTSQYFSIGGTLAPSIAPATAAGVAVAPDGDTVVSDTGNNRVEVFDGSGNYLFQFGTAGSGKGQFSSPTGIAVAANGDIVVSDTGNNRLEVFDAHGNYLIQVGTAGSGKGQFSAPTGVAVAANGNFVVSDSGNNRVEEFNSIGDFLIQFGAPGSGKAQFNAPDGVAVAPNGDIAVADSGNNRVEVFDSMGNYLIQFGTFGTGKGQFSGPAGVAVAANGDIIVSDSGNNREEVFNSIGDFLIQFGTLGAGKGQFSGPAGVAVAANGNFIVVDSGNNRMEVFNSIGNFLIQFGTFGTGNGQFNF